MRKTLIAMTAASALLLGSAIAYAGAPPPSINVNHNPVAVNTGSGTATANLNSGNTTTITTTITGNTVASGNFSGNRNVLQLGKYNANVSGFGNVTVQ
jgi:hypothetical protein